jgi:hypothetical protein
VTLFLHEVHAVAGAEADDFEALYRDEWLPALASTDGARLLWFLHQAHGTGPAYTFITLTALADERAWDALAARVHDGDLADLAVRTDARRHRSTAKLLAPLPWSPLGAVEIDAVPTEPQARGPVGTLFMEDTAWPHRGRREAYLAKAGTLYVDTLAKAGATGRNILELVAAYVPRFGTGHHREIVLWQRVQRPELLLPLLTREVPPEHRAPGTWMHDALEVRDQWESRLLRVADWSPIG